MDQLKSPLIIDDYCSAESSPIFFCDTQDEVDALVSSCNQVLDFDTAFVQNRVIISPTVVNCYRYEFYVDLSTRKVVNCKQFPAIVLSDSFNTLWWKQQKSAWNQQAVLGRIHREYSDWPIVKIIFFTSAELVSIYTPFAQLISNMDIGLPITEQTYNELAQLPVYHNISGQPGFFGKMIQDAEKASLGQEAIHKYTFTFNSIISEKLYSASLKNVELNAHLANEEEEEPEEDFPEDDFDTLFIQADDGF